MDDFFKKNIENKVGYLQEEHILVMDLIYKDACDHGVVKEYEFRPHICQNVPYLDIASLFEYGTDVLDICLNDLERIGFIINTMRNPYKQSHYGITKLGIEYMKERANQEVLEEKV